MEMDKKILNDYFENDYDLLQNALPFRLPDWYRDICLEYGEIRLKPASYNFATTILHIAGLYSLIAVNREEAGGADLADESGTVLHLGFMFIGSFSAAGFSPIGLDFRGSPDSPLFGGEFVDYFDEPYFEDEYSTGYQLISDAHEKVGECRNDVYEQFCDERSFHAFREAWKRSLYGLHG